MALSSAEKTACKSLAPLVDLAFLIKDFKALERFLLRAVLNLSFLTFFMADLMIGMAVMVTWALLKCKLPLYNFKNG